MTPIPRGPVYNGETCRPVEDPLDTRIGRLESILRDVCKIVLLESQIITQHPDQWARFDSFVREEAEQ